MSMLAGIHHVGISTADMERCIHFYSDLLGMQLLSRSETENNVLYANLFGLKNVKAKSAMLKAGDMRLELWEFQRPRGQITESLQPVNIPRITHLCFVVSDVQKEYDRLAAAGVGFHCAPQDFKAAKVVYGRDPEGNIFELIQWAAEKPTTPDHAGNSEIRAKAPL